MLVLQTNLIKTTPSKSSTILPPSPHQNKKTAQVTSFCNSNSKQTPCLLLFLLFFLLLLLTKTKQTKTGKTATKLRTQVHHSRAERFWHHRQAIQNRQRSKTKCLRCFAPPDLFVAQTRTQEKHRQETKKHERKKNRPHQKNTCFRW